MITRYESIHGRFHQHIMEEVPAHIQIKNVDIKITSKHVSGWIFKKYKLQGDVILDDDVTGNMVEFETSCQEYRNVHIGDCIQVPSRWCGRYYHFSELYLPNYRIVARAKEHSDE